MVEKVEFKNIEGAEITPNSRLRKENLGFAKFKIAAKILGPALAISALLSACEGNSQSSNPFGFEIPDLIQTTEEALDFVREQEIAKGLGQVLVKNEEVEITSFVGGIPEPERFPDMMVKIKSESLEEASQIQSKWEDPLDRLFDPIGVCGTTETVNYNDPERDVVVDWTAFVGPQNEETHLEPCP